MIIGPIPVGRDLVEDMSVGYLMANTREDFHVTASVMAEMERIEYNSKKEQSLGCHGFLWNQR